MRWLTAAPALRTGLRLGEDAGIHGDSPACSRRGSLDRAGCFAHVRRLPGSGPGSEHRTLRQESAEVLRPSNHSCSRMRREQASSTTRAAGSRHHSGGRHSDLPGSSREPATRSSSGAGSAPPGSREADSFTPLCSFQTDAAGQGGCFWYFRGLARLNLVQLRAGDENGTQVLGASRPRGPGSIETEPNRFSPGGEIPARQ